MRPFLALLFAFVVANAPSPSMGADPKNFTLASATGDVKFDSSEHRGKVIVLHFLLKTECPYCLRYTHEYAKLAAKSSDVIHVFIKPDDKKEIQQWASHLSNKDLKSLPPIYQDDDAKLAKQFEIPNGYAFHGQQVHFPALVAIDGDGKEMFRYVGKDNSDRMSIKAFQEKLQSHKATTK
jgi:thioredoxin-dependent peroxiredoxin